MKSTQTDSKKKFSLLILFQSWPNIFSLQEKDGLCHLLKEKETELEELKEKLSRLQSEYVRDIRKRK
jgi:hypothetical protein